jgi:RNA polymerase sigma-70 factor (ECF subfamily)
LKDAGRPGRIVVEREFRTVVWAIVHPSLSNRLLARAPMIHDPSWDGKPRTPSGCRAICCAITCKEPFEPEQRRGIVPDTPISLLERLRLRPDGASWQRLVDLYTPLIRNWLRRYDLDGADADDLTQEVMQVLVRELPNFRHDLRTGAFRRWLRNVTVNRLRIFWRGRRARPVAAGGSDFGHMLDQLEDPGSGLSRLWDEEHDRHVAHRLLELIEPEFEPTTWRAFRGLVLESKRTADVAAELGLTPNAVRIAKSRVLGRFREEIDGLLD